MPLEEETLTVMPLFREPLYLVLNRDHELAKYKSIDAKQLAGLEILTLEEHHLFSRQVEDLCNRYHAHLLRDYEGTSLDSIRQMVYMEMGVAILPALYIRSEIAERDELAVVSIAGENMYRTHALAWRDTTPMRSFYRTLGEFFQKMVEQRFGKNIVVV